MIFTPDIEWTFTFGYMADVIVIVPVLQVLNDPFSNLELPHRQNLAYVYVVVLQKSYCSDETLSFHVTTALDLIAL